MPAIHHFRSQHVTVATGPLIGSLLIGLLLTGCTTPHARSSPEPSPPSVAPAPSASTQSTGIGSCDAYLANYAACHRKAGLYTPEQLPAREQAMRESLRQDAMDPATRPQLEQRCRALITQLRQIAPGCDGGDAR